MPQVDLTTVLMELLGTSPYAVLLVLAFVLFYLVHKSDINELNKSHDSAIDVIQAAYKESYDKLVLYLSSRT